MTEYKSYETAKPLLGTGWPRLSDEQVIIACLEFSTVIYADQGSQAFGDYLRDLVEVSFDQYKVLAVARSYSGRRPLVKEAVSTLKRLMVDGTIAPSRRRRF